MTFAGFIIAVAVIGVLFYAWYYFVHRNGTNEAGQMNGQQGNQRPSNTRPAFGSEVGTIGEREAQDQQPAPIRLRQADGTLNNDNVEIGSIGDFKQDLQSEYGLSPKQQDFASSQVQQQVRQDAQQAFSSEVGTIGEAGSQKSGAQQQGMQAQAAQGSNFASSQVQQQVRADAQQAFGSEVGSIGEAGQQQQQLQQQSSSTFANADVQQQMRQDCQQTFSQQSDQSQGQGQNQTAGAAMQKYTVEAGQIGEELSIIDGQGNTLMPNFIPGTNGMGYYPPQVAQEENKKQQ
ncbi:hypothetical protein JJB07_09500 [Tumebacillus sp. ITR2]|uniref:Uncharacterized protein n=1 Tax=Tumebacillus amylolyticus TaxID=2801339 RepID=A0ABS1J9D4_9BACL|nr:hypothetical protein [Tumebacillus amylolyticus]MBL0386887.1 hypothetical protein [Tumebacillus amylolyticus]